MSYSHFRPTPIDIVSGIVYNRVDGSNFELKITEWLDIFGRMLRTKLYLRCVGNSEATG